MQHTTLMEVVRHLPDPRKARGKRHDWVLLLTLIVSALVSGMQNGRAIAQWVQEHAEELLALLQPERGRLPSESTLRRALRQVDIQAVETHLAQYLPTQTAPDPLAGCIVTQQGAILQGQAIDGKAVRGAQAHGETVHLVSRVQHGSGLTLDQVRVEQKRNERSAVPKLLAEQSLHGMVITLDAMHTQRTQAQQILDQGGHYLMMVKKNQRRLWDDLALYFQIPPIAADEEIWDDIQTTSKGHGRIEVRTLECGSGMGDDLDWPGAQQIIRRTTERTVVKTGKRSVEVTYGITSLPANEVSAADLETLWRGHWTIENRKHYVRDVTLGEDAGQMYRGNAPQVLAALRNTIIDLFRWQGWTNMADALRHYGAAVERALTLIGFTPARL
jgi:predicted transposase YbfD/YdcC